jgi:tetratricopeptide (TPR) repeat protein
MTPAPTPRTAPGAAELAASEDRATTADVPSPENRAQVAELPTKARPTRAAIIAVGTAASVILLSLGAAVAVKKLLPRGPGRAAFDLLAEAQTMADKDAVASFGEVEAQINAALLAAGGARFPQAYAALAEAEVQWADAFNDEAWLWGERASRALSQGDDRKKAEAEAKVIALQDAAKSRLKAAFEAAAAGNKLDAKSPDVALALADYYRAARSRANFNRQLQRAALLKADQALAAFIEGADLAAREDGGPKAVERLRAALAAAPQRARIHFRLAMAYQALHQDADAKTELLETLRISPQHERAKMLLELIAGTNGPAGAPEGKK